MTRPDRELQRRWERILRNEGLAPITGKQVIKHKPRKRRVRSRAARAF